MPKLLNIFRKIKYYYSLLTLNNVHKILLGKVKESKKKKKKKNLLGFMLKYIQYRVVSATAHRCHVIGIRYYQ